MSYLIGMEEQAIALYVHSVALCGYTQSEVEFEEGNISTAEMEAWRAQYTARHAVNGETRQQEIDFLTEHWVRLVLDRYKISYKFLDAQGYQETEDLKKFIKQVIGERYTIEELGRLSKDKDGKVGDIRAIQYWTRWVMLHIMGSGCAVGCMIGVQWWYKEIRESRSTLGGT